MKQKITCKQHLVIWFFCMALTAILIQSPLFSATVHAESTVIQDGNLTWTFDDNGTLTISGEGAMQDYNDYNNTSPAFQNYETYNLKKIVIQDGITYIGAYAFFSCYSVTEIEIPDSVTDIGAYAFSSCTHLQAVNLPKDLTKLPAGAFHLCLSLESITIPATLQEIGKSAFRYCHSLDLTVPATVTSIGEKAFYEMFHVQYEDTKITDTYGARSIYGYVDNYVAYTDATKTELWAARATLTGAFTIPESVTRIRPGAFSDCDNLTSITIPDSVKCIEEKTFYLCKALTKITLPDGLQSIGYRAFYQCNQLSDINIPDCVSSIGDGAFSFCEALTNITLPDGLQCIDKNTFSYCLALTNLIIPDSVSSIGENAFSFCGALTNVTLPDGLQSIGDQAFYICPQLSGINIPDSVSSIGENVFRECTNLTIRQSCRSALDLTTLEYTDCIKGVERYHQLTGDEITAAWDLEQMQCSLTFQSDCTCGNPLPAASTVACTSAVTAPATCIAMGTTTYSASYTWYGGTFTLTRDEKNLAIDTSHHTGETTLQNTKAATCTESGYTGDVFCAGCQALLTKGNDIAPLGHDYASTFTIDTPATCTAVGSQSKHCTRCDAKTEVTAIPMLAHTWNDGQITKAATTAAEGEKTYTCKVCGTTRTEVLPKVEATTTETPKTDDVTTPAPKKGDIRKDAKNTGYYTITNVGKHTVSFLKPVSKKVTRITIPNTVKIDGTTYTVTGIASKAFANCKKLKTVTIKATRLTTKSMSKKAFQGISKKAAIKVPKKKLSAYKKLFRSKGLSKKVKITK